MASPYAKKLARESNVSLLGVTGTGPRGRIIASDVMTLVANNISHPTRSTSATVGMTTDTLSSLGIASTDVVDVPIDDACRMYAQSLTLQKQTVPHYHLTTSLDVDAMEAMRQTLNRDLQDTTAASSSQSPPSSLALYDFLLLAATRAVTHVPEVNAAWMESFIRQFKTVNVNVIMSNADGRVVAPVLRHDTAGSGLVALSTSFATLQQRVKSNTLTSDDLQGGTFTITNMGMFGVTSLAPIVAASQSCALALGAVSQVVVPDASQQPPMRVVSRLTATLACDHRVVDGAVGAKYLSVFKSLVENPLRLLL